MERTTLPFFYELGASLNALTTISAADPEQRTNILFAAANVQSNVFSLFTLFEMLAVCRGASERLDEAIAAGFNWFQKVASSDYSKVAKADSLADSKFRDIIETAKKFEVVLLAELQTLAAYHVTQKGIYSTPDLIERAEQMLPPSVLAKMTDRMKSEIRESGRCLAFDSFTASGFHILRATEVKTTTGT